MPANGVRVSDSGVCISQWLRERLWVSVKTCVCECVCVKKSLLPLPYLLASTRLSPVAPRVSVSPPQQQ